MSLNATWDFYDQNVIKYISDIVNIVDNEVQISQLQSYSLSFNERKIIITGKKFFVIFLNMI